MHNHAPAYKCTDTVHSLWGTTEAESQAVMVVFCFVLFFYLDELHIPGN